MAKNKIPILTIVLICFSLYFLVITVNTYAIEKRTTTRISEAIYPDSIIPTENGSFISNPEAITYEIEMDLDFELLDMARTQLRIYRNILLVFIFLTIISFKMFLLEKKIIK